MTKKPSTADLTQKALLENRVSISDLPELAVVKFLDFLEHYAPRFITKTAFILYGLLWGYLNLYWHKKSWFRPFAILLHDDFLTQKQFDLDILRNTIDPEEFIKEAFNTASGCSFLIFYAIDGEYLQFWVKHNALLHSFPLHPNTNMPQHELDFIKHMKHMNFTHLPKEPSQAIPFVYYQQQQDGFLEYLADFGSERDLAAAYTKAMFTQSFNEELRSVRVTVG